MGSEVARPVGDSNGKVYNFGRKNTTMAAR